MERVVLPKLPDEGQAREQPRERVDPPVGAQSIEEVIEPAAAEQCTRQEQQLVPRWRATGGGGDPRRERQL